MDILGDDLPWRKILAYMLEIRTRSQPLRVFRNFISKRWPLGGNPGSKFSFSWWRPVTSKCLFWAWICMFSDYELLDAESVQFSRSVVSNSLWPHGLQHPRPPCPSPTPRACSNSYPLSWWCHPTISSYPPLSPSPPAFSLTQHQGLFQWVSSSHQVAKVLKFQLYHQSFQWTPRTDLL